jgi:hypothetical protein
MKRIYRSLAIFFGAISLTGLLFASKISATEGSCYLKAMRTDVFVILHELNRDGDKGAKLWEGRIDEGQEILISAPHARFRLYYNDQPDIDQPMSGGNDRWCDNQRTVGVP